MLKNIIGVFALSLMLVACGDESVSEDVSTTDVAVENEAVIGEDLISEVKKEADARSEVEQNMLNFFKENLSGTMSISFSEETKTYAMMPIGDGFTDELMLTATGDIGAESWYGVVYGFVDLSEMVQENLGDGYSIVMLNPSNTENILLLITDGKIQYDFLSDL